MTTRQEKVKDLLKEEISDILRREFKDPRLGFVTIVDAEVTSDLRHAKVFVSILGSDQERDQNIAILKNAQKFFRQSLSKRIRMKTLPEIDFRLDTSAERGVRILELLEQVKHDEQDGAS